MFRENNNYYPFSFDEIMSIFHRWLNGRPDKEEIKKKIEICNHRKMYVREK